MCLTLGLVCVQLLDLQIRNTICRHWKYVSPSDPGVYKWCSIYKYKIQDVCTWNTSHPGTSVSATVTTFHGLLWPFSATQRFPRIFQQFPQCPQTSYCCVHQRLFQHVIKSILFFRGGRGTRVPIYFDSWYNVDILIVVTMLNVDAWRRSSVGWEKLSPSMQSTVCSPFHCFALICIGFCSYLQCTDCICIGFCSYLHWILLIIVLQLTLRTSQNVPAQTVPSSMIQSKTTIASGLVNDDDYDDDEDDTKKSRWTICRISHWTRARNRQSLAKAPL